MCVAHALSIQYTFSYPLTVIYTPHIFVSTLAFLALCVCTHTVQTVFYQKGCGKCDFLTLGQKKVTFLHRLEKTKSVSQTLSNKTWFAPFEYIHTEQEKLSAQQPPYDQSRHVQGLFACQGQVPQHHRVWWLLFDYFQCKKPSKKSKGLFFRKHRFKGFTRNTLKKKVPKLDY